MVAPVSRTGPPSLTAWVYASTVGASAGEVRLRRLGQRGAVTVEEAVTVTWAPGAHRPRIGLLRPVPKASESVLHALGSCLWPTEVAPGSDDTGRAIRVAGLTPHLVAAGIDTGFLNDIRAAVAPGASALLVLALDADLDVIRAVIERGRARGDVVLLHTWLTSDAARHIRAARRHLDTG